MASTSGWHNFGGGRGADRFPRARPAGGVFISDVFGTAGRVYISEVLGFSGRVVYLTRVIGLHGYDPQLGT